MAESVKDLKLTEEALKYPQPWHPFVEMAIEKIEEFRKLIPKHNDGFMRCIEKGEGGNSMIGWGKSQNGFIEVKAMYGSGWYHGWRTFHLSLENWDVMFISKDRFCEEVAHVLHEAEEWEKKGPEREAEERNKKIQEDMERRKSEAAKKELDEWRNKPLRKWWSGLWEKRQDGLAAQMKSLI